MSADLPSVLILAGLGLIVGSFLAAVSVRLPLDEDAIVAPSRCRSCRRPLRPWNLIPVVSWIVQRGRCADCGAGISWRYPAVELASGLLGAWAAWQGGGWVMAALTAVLAWQLLLIALIDGEHFWLPDALTWPLAATGIAANAWLLKDWPIAAMIGAVFAFGLLWALAWLYRRVRGREGLGGGDPFLFGAIGAWVGWMGLPSVLLWACAAGFSVIGARLLVRRRVEATDRLPFGVFLAIGAWLTWLYGPLGL